MNRNLLIGLGVLVAVVLVGFYFVKGSKPSYAPTYTAPAVSSQPAVSAVPSGPVHEIKVSAKEFAYTPSTISVKKGENIKIIFTNDGSFSHNFTIAELGVATKTIGAGETDSVAFTADTVGTYTFFCSVDGHKDLGLKGTLTVK